MVCWWNCSRRKLRIHAFLLSFKLCLMLAIWRIGNIMPPTYSGVPQGSIVSPILANVLLHELDVFMNHMKQRFDQGKKRKANPIYRRYCGKIERLRRKGDSLKGKEERKHELLTFALVSSVRVQTQNRSSKRSDSSSSKTSS